jgi:hypothetical protein
MSSAGAVRGVYPVALLIANVGVGTWLYSLGAVAAAVALWVAGALVVSGILSAVGCSIGWPGPKTL